MRNSQSGQARLQSLARSNSGQALLIVVLIMVVSLTVGLSVISRTITNLRTTTEEENSQRAFSAAEAGVEQAIKLGCALKEDGTCEAIPQGGFASNFSTFSVNIAQISGTEFLPNAGNLVKKDDSVDIWLIPHKSDGTLDYSVLWNGDLTIYWGSYSDSCANTKAAVEIVLLTGTGFADVKLTRYPVDSCNSPPNDRVANNKFCSTTDPPPAGCPTYSAGGSVGGKSFANSAKITGITNGLLVRVTPLYANTAIGVKGTVSLPSQGKRIESIGKAGTTERKIIYYQGYSVLPAELFPHVILSPS